MRLEEENPLFHAALSEASQWVSRHFGPETFRHHQTGAEVSGRSALVPKCLGSEVSWHRPSGLQSHAYWELCCFIDCWRHQRNRWPGPRPILLWWRP